MGQAGAVALGTRVKCRHSHLVVGAALAGAGF